MITFIPVNCWKSCKHTPITTLHGGWLSGPVRMLRQRLASTSEELSTLRVASRSVLFLPPGHPCRWTGSR